MPRLRTVTAALSALVAAVALSACGGGSSPQHALPALHSSRSGPVSMYTTGELGADPGPALDQLQTLGIQTVHLYVNWSAVTPGATSFHKPSFNATNPAAYSATLWQPYDAMIRGLRARHMSVILSLTGLPPLWAEGKGAPKPKTQSEWKPNADEYEQWVESVARRYNGHFTPAGSHTPLPRVSFWSSWNEPNIGSNLGPETPAPGSSIEVAPRLYRHLLDGFWTALHASGHGLDRILIGELAPMGPTDVNATGVFNSMAPLRFLRALYCTGSNDQPLRGRQATLRGCPATAAASAHFRADNPALFDASGFAIHPYSLTSLPPDTQIPNQPDDVPLASIAKFETVLDRVVHVYGSDTRFPLWNTEFGYITNPPNPEYTITPAKAAYYLNWAEYLSWENPRIKSYDQYEIADPPSTAPAFTTGLETATGAPKPGYAAFRMPIYLPVSTASASHPLVVWGQVRPAPAARRRTGRAPVVQIQYRHGSSGPWSTVQRVTITNPNGFFEVHQTFKSAGSVRLRWSYPDGTTVFSRLAAITK